MYKGFAKNNFRGFPNVSSFGNQIFSEAYGFGKVDVWLDAAENVSATTNLEAVSFWNNKVNQVPFYNFNTSFQPRLLLSDSDFGAKPVIDFHTQGRGLQSDFPYTVTPYTTQAIVYQYLSAGGGSYQSRIFGDTEFANSRAAGRWFGWSRNNNGSVLNEVGFYDNGMIARRTTDDIFTALPYIVIVNRNNFLANGAQVTLTSGLAADYLSINLQAIGAGRAPSSQTLFAGTFKIAEFINIRELLTEAQCLNLSDSLNSKYAIY